MKRQLTFYLCFIFQLTAFTGGAQGQSAPQGKVSLPDVDTLLQVATEKQNVYALERQRYICVMKSHDITNNTTRHYESFYTHRREIKRLLAINDQPLDPSRQEQENARVKQEIQADLQKPALSFASLAGGWSFSDDDHPWSETVEGAILRMSSFSDETSIVFKGRPAFQIEFHGNTKTKANTPEERVAKVFAGSIVVDAADGAIIRIEGEAKSDVKDVSSVLVGRGYKFTYDALKIAEGLYVPSAWATSIYVYAADPKANPPFSPETQDYQLQSCRVNE